MEGKQWRQQNTPIRQCLPQCEKNNEAVGNSADHSIALLPFSLTENTPKERKKRKEKEKSEKAWGEESGVYRVCMGTFDNLVELL